MQNSLQNLQLSNRKDVAERRISFGVSSVYALRDALLNNKDRDQEKWGLCNRLWKCSERENHFVGDDLHNVETGELYAGNGVFFSCGSKLCPSCVSKASNRSRKELRSALENQKLLTGENYQLISLTIPNPNLSLLQTREILNRAYTLFRKREYFVERIRGGSKSEEFTVTENGYHYHYHLLCITRFLKFNKFRSEWTDCVRTAFKENNIPFEVGISDGLLMVNIKRVSSSNNGLKGAIQEVCKYVTKSDSWGKIPGKDLVEIASIKRFPRMFELFRSFRTQRNANILISSHHPYLTYLLLNAVLQIIKFRTENYVDYTILDTKEISDGKLLSEIEDLPEKVPKKKKSLDWRDYIRAYGLRNYLERLDIQVHNTREIRKCFLLRKYPYAKLWTMDGKIIEFNGDFSYIV